MRVRVKRVEDLLIIRVINIFLFPSFSPNKIESLIKPRQRNKEPDSPGKYIKKLILGEVQNSLRVPKQRGYKNKKRPGQFQPSKSTAIAQERL